jgi:uncharacterized protein DUF3560
MLTIRHTHVDGNLVEGTERGDGTQPLLTASGLRWSRDLAVWYLPRSRDQLARRELLETLAARLHTAGHIVDVEVDDTPRPAGQVEADHAERAAARAERLTRRSERARAASDAHAAAAKELADHIPLGQPVLVDHHSAPRHQRDLERIRSNDRAAWEADQEAREAARRAELAAGVVADYGRHSIRVGDMIQYGDDWYPVERANAKTVSIRSRVGGSWTERIPYHQICGHQPASAETSRSALQNAGDEEAPLPCCRRRAAGTPDHVPPTTDGGIDIGGR